MLLFKIMLICIQILHVLAQIPSQISGPLQWGVRVTGTIIKTDTLIGEKMCAERCFRETSCGAFNFFRFPELKCELVLKDSHIAKVPQDGVKSAIITEWTGFKGGCVHNPCPDKHQTCYNKDKVKRYCVFAECLWLPNVNKRFVSLDTSKGLNRKIGETMSYKCDKGFKMKGRATITCLESRKFSAPDPALTCYRFLGDYFMAARFTSGNLVPTYATWMDNTINSDEDPTIQDACFSIDKDANCTKHYVSGVVNNWQNHNILEVKMSMFKNGAEVAYVKFLGVGTTKTNWFSKSNILGSTWTDVTKDITANVLSIYGLTKPVIRRFYLSNFLKSCYDDLGWICVIEGPGICSYDSLRDYPFFFYSTKSTKALLETEFGIADNMVILLKIANFP